MRTYLLLKQYDKHTVFTLVNKDEVEKIQITIKHVCYSKTRQGNTNDICDLLQFVIQLSNVISKNELPNKQGNINSLLYSTIGLSNVISKSELPNQQITSCNEITWCLASIRVLTEKQQHSFSMSLIFFSTKGFYCVNG